MAKAIKAKTVKTNTVGVAKTESYAEAKDMPSTAKDETIACPFTRRNEYKNLQAGIVDARLWLQSLGKVRSVVVSPKSTRHYPANVKLINGALVDGEPVSVTSYEVAEDDAMGGIRLDVQAILAWASADNPKGHRFINVYIDSGKVQIKA